MEVVKNETIEEKQESQQMSEFCEELMKATDGINDIRQEGDCAFLICSDGINVAARKCGNRQMVLQSLYSLMKNDDDIAELIIEAGMYYSHDMLGRRVAKKIDNLN